MKLDEMEFGRRLAVERELAERSPEAARRENAEWDETGNFLLYPSLVGIKGTLFAFGGRTRDGRRTRLIREILILHSRKYDNKQSRSNPRQG